LTYTAPQQPIAPAQRPTSGLAIAGLLTGIFFWPAGIIINPIALAKIKKSGDGGRGLAVAGLIISILGLLGTVIAIIVTTLAAAAVVGTAGAVAESIDEIGTVDQSVSIGETGTTAGGIAFTLSSLNCGIPSVGDEYLNVVAQGQFCEANVTVVNNGTEPHFFTDSDATGYIGEVEYATDSTAGIYAENNDVFFNEINPGNQVVGKVYFDIPAGANLERIELAESMFAGVVEVVL
jgi:hypothetical protein